MTIILFITIISGLVFGFVAIFIAEKKKVRHLTAFLFGFFLGPIGLIIVALLNINSNHARDIESDRFFGESSLSNDSYRLWLYEKNNVKHNAIFNKYIVDDKLFDSLCEAIQFCHEKEALIALKCLISKKESQEENIKFQYNIKRLSKITIYPLVIAVAFATTYQIYVLYTEYKIENEINIERNNKVNSMKEELSEIFAEYMIDIHPRTVLIKEQLGHTLGQIGSNYPSYSPYSDVEGWVPQYQAGFATYSLSDRSIYDRREAANFFCEGGYFGKEIIYPVRVVRFAIDSEESEVISFFNKQAMEAGYVFRDSQYVNNISSEMGFSKGSKFILMDFTYNIEGSPVASGVTLAEFCLGEFSN